MKSNTQDKITASEALFGFIGWITTQSTPIIASSKHDVSVWANKIGEFCKVNNFSEPRAGWAKYLIMPKSEDAQQKDSTNRTSDKEGVDDKSEVPPPIDRTAEFKKELTTLLNTYCIENICDMPDFLLAEMLVNFVEAVGDPLKKNLDWHGCDSICHPKKK